MNKYEFSSFAIIPDNRTETLAAERLEIIATLYERLAPEVGYEPNTSVTIHPLRWELYQDKSLADKWVLQCRMMVTTRGGGAK